MESAQRELLSVLLGDIFSRGLISKSTYLKAEDLVHSMTDLPGLFQYPVCSTEEAGNFERAQDTK